jgi:carboxylesterase type B
VGLAWLPRVDGVFLTADPQDLIMQGSVADIPFITGDCDDEGTLFSLSSLNITLVYYSYHFSHANLFTAF